MCTVCAWKLSRRGILAGLTATALAGCSENADTGRRQLVFVSDEQLVSLADQSWSEIARQTPISRDARAYERVQRVGRPIVQASGRQDLQWQFTVFETADVNAFVLPNGRVGVFRGLLNLARTDDELAAVLGHEVGHIIARHPAERVSQELAVNAGVSIVQMVLSGDGNEYAGEIAAALGMGAVYGVVLPYSRRHELEADRVGVQLAAKAGYDPQGAVSFWQRMMARDDAKAQPPEVLSTHPADERRLVELKDAIAQTSKA